jgi:enoyl-CoA hydratase/carnithine racemase
MGVPPEAASSALFPQRMGWQRAAGVLLTGEWMSAEAAVAAGMATESSPEREVVAKAMAAAERIAAGPEGAGRTIKGLMQAAQRDAVLAARAREEDAYARMYGKAAT